MQPGHPLVFETDEASFARDVIEASRETPILVDFRAEWCEPCKTLGPVLERLAAEYAGGFRVARVDADREERLAAMFRIQSIPFVVAISGGSPLDAFQGALPEPELRSFLDRLGIRPAAEPDADEAEAAGPFAEAVAFLRAPDARAFAGVEALLASVDEDDDDYPRVQRIADAAAWFSGSFAPTSTPGDLALRARELWLEARPEDAMQALFDAVVAGPRARRDLARKALVALMQVFADRADFVAALRRRLAAELY